VSVERRSANAARSYGNPDCLVLDFLLDDFATALEGYLTRVQMLDFLV
jgi:hypothetical protein